VIAPDDPRADDVRALLAVHLAWSHTTTPPEDVHALDVDGLCDPAVAFFSYRVGGELLGIGALKRLDDAHAEVKSMHTVAAARGRGIGRAMVEHLLATARAQGCTRVSLETGSMEAFAPARALYEAVGFAPTAPTAPSSRSSCSNPGVRMVPAGRRRPERGTSRRSAGMAGRRRAALRGARGPPP
jgi:putative acetyltransferase